MSNLKEVDHEQMWSQEDRHTVNDKELFKKISRNDRATFLYVARKLMQVEQHGDEDLIIITRDKVLRVSLQFAQ